MTSLFRSLLFLSLGGLLTQCTRDLTPPLPDSHNTWPQQGVTAKREIAQRYGQPADVLPEGEGQSAWLYVAMTAAPHGVSFIPVIGIFAGGSSITITELTLHFTGDVFQFATHATISKYQNMFAGITDRSPVAVQEQTRVEHEMATLGLPFDAAAWEVTRRAVHVRQMLQDR